MSQITRFGISMDTRLLERFDKLIAEHGYTTRSEAFRDMVRERLVQEEWTESDASGETVGTITIIYDHHQRELTENLNEQQHRHHHAVLSMMHLLSRL